MSKQNLVKTPPKQFESLVVDSLLIDSVDDLKYIQEHRNLRKLV